MNQSASQRSRQALIWLVVIAAAGVFFFGPGPAFLGSRSSSWKDRQIPSIANDQGTWINAPSGLDWDQLRGQVVWLEFSFLH